MEEPATPFGALGGMCTFAFARNCSVVSTKYTNQRMPVFD